MMNLTYLQSFAAVVSQGGFSAAAEHLKVSKGLVSRHVNKLESELGTKLLHRTTRVIRLSEAGEKLYLEAQKIFSLARTVERDIQDITQEASGLLRFTAPMSIGDRIIRDLLPRYQALCPNVVLELNFSNQAYDLASGENDIALRAFETLPDLVVARSVGKMRNVLVASEQYLAKHSAIERLEDLAEHNCILNSHQQAWNVWRFEPCVKETSLQCEGANTLDKEMPIVVNGSVATSKYATAKILAEQGVGVANLPWYFVEQAVLDKKLQLLLTQYVTFVHEMTIVHASQRQLPKKVKVFKDLLIEWFELHPEYCQH